MNIIWFRTHFCKRCRYAIDSRKLKWIPRTLLDLATKGQQTRVTSDVEKGKKNNQKRRKLPVDSSRSQKELIEGMEKRWGGDKDGQREVGGSWKWTERAPVKRDGVTISLFSSKWVAR